MKLLQTLLLSIFCGFGALAQQKISGKVFDEKNQAAEFATVALLSAKDSSMVKANLTDAAGVYHFESVNKGRYLISISMMGYQKAFSAVFSVDQSPVTIETITLKTSSKTLDEVTVTAQKPFLEQRADKLVVNVANSPASVGSTAIEVLQKVPGLIIAQDRITIAGKASVSIMIDGKPSQYTDMNQVLKDLPSNSIEKIEVIKNPSAKYDAAGGAVINIIMKRNANLGTNGSVALDFRGAMVDNTVVNRSKNDFFGGYSPNFSLNHRKGKWNVFGSYTYSDRTFFQLTQIDRVIGKDEFSNIMMNPGDAKVHNARLGADYYLDKKNTIGILLTGFDRSGSNNSTAITKVFSTETKQQTSQFETLNDQPTTRNNIGYNLNWKHTFDSTGRELNVDLDYVQYKLKNQNLITILDNGLRRNNSQSVDNPVQFMTAKLDYTHPISKDSKLEAGGKMSFATIDNDLRFYREQVLDTKRSNVFNYKENINALYVNYNTSFGKKWELQTGLRTEQTVATGFSQVENKNVLERNYWQFFPSIFLTHKLNKSLAVTTSFTRRIDRPSYQQQNPFEFQIDSLTFTRGNPLLKPQLTNEIKLQLTFDGQPFFALGYNNTNDVIVDNAPKQDPATKRTYTTAENLATYKNYFVELNFPIKIGKKISGYGGNQLIYNAYNANYLGGTFDQSRVNWLAYFNINAKFTNKLSMEMGGWYMTRSQQEFLTLNPLGALTIGLQYKVLEGKGKISLAMNDVFYTEKTRGLIEYQDINLKYFSREASQNLRLGFSYSFGNQKLKASRSRQTGSESESNRVKAN